MTAADESLQSTHPVNTAGLIAAAHELKTPLAVIGNLAASLRDDSLELSPAEQRQYLERIQLTTERMARLVEGLTQSYRLSQERQLAFNLLVEPVNISQLCEETVHELWPLATQLQQTVRIHLPRKQQVVVAHHELLHNVLLNLLDNALKHNPRGTQVELSSRQSGDFTRLLVRDNGPAVSRAEFRQLHQRLGREVQPTALRAGSSGLGLYIASQLTKAMGGTLGAVRHRTAGMTFYAELVRSTQLSLL